MRKQREVLPENYDMAIAEINHRFYPLRIRKTEERDLILDNFAQFTWSFEDEWFIPSALGPRHTTGVVSFPTYAEAITFCHRREEHWELLFDWERHRAGTDLYPEQSAWYKDEIQRLVGAYPYITIIVNEAHAWVCDRQGTSYSVYAEDIYEAVVALYEAVASAHGSIQHEDAPVSVPEVEVSA